MPDEPEFHPGDLYEDCAFHPCLCTEVDDDDLSGISLIDGSAPRSCSINHCGPQALTIAQVMAIRGSLDEYVARRNAGLSIEAALGEQPTET